MVLGLGESPRRFLWCWLSSSFCCCCIFICRYFSFCCCSSHCFSTSSLTLPWTIGLSPGFLHPILYFQLSPSQSDLRHFHLLNHSVLAASATALSGHFLPTGVLYLRLLPNIFGTTCFYQGLSGSWQFFLEVCRASYWSSKHRPCPAVCLIHSNPQSLYILNLYLYMSIFQKFYLWWKLW